jgi:hypothetical protein
MITLSYYNRMSKDYLTYLIQINISLCFKSENE